jgi:hypothetical protein
MVTFAQVKSGISKYITEEIISKMDGWKQWVSGAAVAIALTKADALFEALKSNAIISMLGVAKEDGMIDLDVLRKAFKEQAESSGPVSIDIPAIGKITLSSNDIDMIYRYIQEEG